MSLVRSVTFWLALVVPALLVAVVIHRYGVNVPTWDQWVLVDPLVDMEAGRFPWASIVGQHNEHRMVFPKLIMFPLAYLTRWNTLVELWVSFVLAAGSLAVLLALLRPVLGNVGPGTRFLAALLVSATLYSLAQWENWLWGWQIQWLLSVLAAISSIALATRSLRAPDPWPWVASAAAAAIVVQYSIASGVVAWACGGLILAHHRRRSMLLPVWLLIAAGTTALYFIGYAPNPGHPSPWIAYERPLALLHYIGNYLSGPLGRHAAIGFAAVAAWVALALAAVLRHRHRPELFLPWIALAVFALGNAFITGVGRVGFGVEQGLQSRYTTIALLLPLSMVPLGVLVLHPAFGGDRPRIRPALGLGAALLMLALLVRADIESLRPIVDQGLRLRAGRACVVRVDQASDECLMTVFQAALPVRHWTRQLEAIGWSGFPAFREQPRGTLRVTAPGDSRTWQLRPADGSTGWIESAQRDGAAMVVRGWARHPERGEGKTNKVLVVSGDTVSAEAAYVGEATIADPSPGIAELFHDPTLARSAWGLRLENAVTSTVPLRFRAYLVLSGGALMPLDGQAVATP